MSSRFLPTRPTLRMSAGPDETGRRPSRRFTIRYSLPPFEQSDHWESEVRADSFDDALTTIRGTLVPRVRSLMIVMTVEISSLKLSSKIHGKTG